MRALLSFAYVIGVILAGVTVQVALNITFGKELRNHRVIEFVIVGLSTTLVGMVLIDKLRGCL